MDVSIGCFGVSIGSLRHTEWNGGAFGVNIQALQLGPQHQVHVFDRDRPQQHLIAKHHGAGEAAAIAEAHLHKAHWRQPGSGGFAEENDATG